MTDTEALHEWRQAAYQASRERNSLREQLDLATEFRIPCPGHFYGGSQSDLIVRRNRDGQGWCIINPSWPENGEHVWDDRQWRSRSELSRVEIYRYSRDEALTEAPKLADVEAARSRVWADEMYARGNR